MCGNIIKINRQRCNIFLRPFIKPIQKLKPPYLFKILLRGYKHLNTTGHWFRLCTSSPAQAHAQNLHRAFRSYPASFRHLYLNEAFPKV